MISKKFLIAAVVLSAFGAGSSSALAANTPCSAYNTTGVADTNAPNELYRENMTLNGTMADNCYGHVDVPGGNNPGSVQTYVNGFNGGAGLFGANDWQWVVRFDNNGNSTQDYNGLRFTITSLDIGNTTGSFTLQVTDVGNPLNLPAIIDLIGTVKASQGTDFFYFDDEVISSANPGTFKLTYNNTSTGGVNGLSDFTFLVRDGRNQGCPANDPFCTPTRIPEPGSLALAGLALAATGLAALRRRRRG